MFSNGGIEYASILMSVLLNHTNDIARIYCQGFKSELITTQPYWTELKKYLEKPHHKLFVMVQNSDHVNEPPLQLLHKIKQERIKNGQDGTIEMRMITTKGKEMITREYGEDCNFAVFDNNKFRYEYDPENFRAHGSFNQPETCEKFITLFDNAFHTATPLLFMNND